MPLEFLKVARKALRFRLTLWYSTIFALSCLLLFALLYYSLTASLGDSRTLIQSKLKEYQSLVQESGIPALEKKLADGGRPNRRKSFFVRVVGPDNETVFLSNPRLWEKFDLMPRQDRFAEEQWQYFPARRDGELLEVISGFLPDHSVLQVGKTLQDREEILERLRDKIVEIMIPMILIGLAGGVLLASRALQPIRELIHTTQTIIATGKMDARVPIGRTGDELDELVKLFNRMLERIESLIKGMRESLDNVAHDLRTPMTRLRGIAEMTLHSNPDRQHYEEARATCVEESDRILTLLNTIMDISEAETGTMKLTFEEVRISNLMEEIAGLYEYVAEEKNIAVSVHCPKDIRMTTDRNRMRQVLANLLDNAIKYTADGGSIVIHAYQEQKRTVIVIRDTGVGMPPDDIPRIWDRLYRGDKSRSQRGLGVGLSLVKAVVQAHKGRIEVHSEVNAGSVFTLYLPTLSGPTL